MRSLPKKSSHSPLQKRESTGASFLYWLDWKSKHFSWNVNEWQPRSQGLFPEGKGPGNEVEWMKIYPSKFKSFQRKIVQMGALQKLQNSIQTLIIFWHVLPNPYKLSILGDHFAIFLLQIILFVVIKTLKFIWSFIWTSLFFKQTENNHTLSQSSHVSGMAYSLWYLFSWSPNCCWFYLFTGSKLWTNKTIWFVTVSVKFSCPRDKTSYC